MFINSLLTGVFMNREQRIYDILNNNLECLYIEVKNNSHLHRGHLGDDGTLETHYKVIVESDSLKILSRVDAHKAIKRLLKGEFDSGLHALEIKLIK